MALSNTATPYYYGKFRDAVLAGEIPVCREISMEMVRIDKLIANPAIYYDEDAINGFIKFCESELTLTDGEDLYLLDTFKLWAEQIFGWYYFIEKSVYDPEIKAYRRKVVKKRLITKQILIVARGAAKSLYESCIQGYFLTVVGKTTHQVTTAPTMKQAEEVMSPLRTAIARARGPYFKMLTEGSINNTTGDKANRQKLAPTKKGIEMLPTNSLLEVRPMTIDKLQGLRAVIFTIDEWLSGDIKEDIVSAAEQGASKNPDYLILLVSSEGTVRNGVGDTMKIEIYSILRGDYEAIHTSIWYYKLDSIDEVGMPEMWVKAQPNIGKTVDYEIYQQDVERAEQSPSARNDILAKRFGLPMEGFTYFFTYEETKLHPRFNVDGMPCALGADLSRGDDFCAFDLLFPLQNGNFCVKVKSYISELTYSKLPLGRKQKYDEFIAEGTLIVMNGSILDLNDVYDDLDEWIEQHEYDVRTFGYDPYNARDFVERWVSEHGPFGVEKVIQGVKTESVPLGEIKNLTESNMLIFDENLMSFTMGNAITIEDTNGNRKLLKARQDEKIDNVAALVDAFVSYKLNKEAYE